MVSVVVPTHEVPDGLAVTLESLYAQTYPSDRYEIIVVVDSDAPETQSLLEASDPSDATLRWFVEGEYHTPGAARNVGVKEAAGSILAFVDADMTLPPEWVVKVVDEFEESDADYMGVDVLIGPARASGDDSLIVRYNREFLLDVEHLLEAAQFVPTCSLVTTKETFEEVGPIDPRLIAYEDYVFGNAVAKAGRSQAFCSTTQAVHPPRESFRAFVKRGRKMGLGRSQIREYYPEFAEERGLTFSWHRYRPDVVFRAIREGHSDWAGLSRREKVGFWALAYTLALAGFYGVFRGSLSIRLGREPSI